MRIVVPSTAASYFHALRRQVKSRVAKPLIAFTPKSLLRTRASYSERITLTDGRFEAVIPAAEPAEPRRVVFCSGKFFYDLADARTDESVALVRIEQLDPFPVTEVAEVLAAAPSDAEIMWAQEEPSNMGAWTFVRPRLADLAGRQIRLVARAESASPATGSHRLHDLEQGDLVDEVFG